MKIILASQSPRRKELFKMLFEEFEICVSDIEENVPETITLPNVPSYLAVQKALDIAKNHPEDFVVGCDTIVAFAGSVFGKPKDRQDAEFMITALSGATHKVYTGVCYAYKGKTYSFTEETEITFYPLTENQVKKYTDTDEPYDKAGGYGIQGLASAFVKGIHGDFYNVVGLPVSRMLQELKTFEKISGEHIETIWE